MHKDVDKEVDKKVDKEVDKEIDEEFALYAFWFACPAIEAA